MVQVTRVDGTTYEAHAKFAEKAENGNRGLASELLASLLAGLVRANVPRAEVVELPPGQLIALGDGSHPAVGLAVACETIDPWVDINAAGAILDVSVDDLALLSVVQCWTEVQDRGHNMIRSRDKVYAIDFASAFGSIWTGSAAVPPLVEDSLIQNRLAAAPLAMRAAADCLESVSNDAIDQAVAEVPNEWMDPSQKGAFCARLKTTRQSVAERLRSKYPIP